MIYNLEEQIVNTYYTDYKFFFNKPNVEGIGYGYKYINEICTLEPAIHIYVSKKIPSYLLSNDALIPSLYKNIKTDVIETGIFTEGYCPWNLFNYNKLSKLCLNKYSPIVPPYIKKIRPVECGYCASLVNPTVPKTGTLGYIVTDNKQISKTYCFLSNNSTFANYNSESIGAPIIQPAFEYGGYDPNNIIARLLRFIPINFLVNIPNSIENFNTVDAAVANSTTLSLINPFIPGIGIPRGIVTPSLLQSLKWTGCISGTQKGSVIGVKTMIRVYYDSKGFAYFKNIILCGGEDIDVRDRGTLAFDLNSQAVGLIFGKSVPRKYKVICSIESIQSALDVKLLTF